MAYGFKPKALQDLTHERALAVLQSEQWYAEVYCNLWGIQQCVPQRQTQPCTWFVHLGRGAYLHMVTQPGEREEIRQSLITWLKQAV